MFTTMETNVLSKSSLQTWYDDSKLHKKSSYEQARLLKGCEMRRNCRLRCYYHEFLIRINYYFNIADASAMSGNKFVMNQWNALVNTEFSFFSSSKRDSLWKLLSTIVIGAHLFIQNMCITDFVYNSCDPLSMIIIIFENKYLLFEYISNKQILINMVISLITVTHTNVKKSDFRSISFLVN